MRFTVIKARYHPILGLELTDSNGVAFRVHTIKPVLAAGAVTFVWNEPVMCPYHVHAHLRWRENMPFEDHVWDGTDDPVALELARAYADGAPVFSDDWQDVTLPPS